MSKLKEHTEYLEYSENKTELLSDKKKSEMIKSPLFGKRHVQVLNICFMVFVAYYSRNCLSVAIVAMNGKNSSSNSNIPTFNWTNKNTVLSAFFIGYVPVQFIIGFFITMIRIKVYAISSILICSALGLLTPLVATTGGDKGVIAIRILQGITQGFVFPLAQHLLAQWVPPNERAVLGGAVYAAQPVGAVLPMIIPGYIAASYYGWPWIFYSANMLAIVWCIFFAFFSYEKPSTHPYITPRERKYIEDTLGKRNTTRKRLTPYKAIFTSVPFWANIVTGCGNMWCFWTLQTQMPMYFKYVMKYDMEKTGSMSAVPYLFQWLVSYVFCFASDYLLTKNIWKLTTARKVMNSIGFFAPALCFILLQNCGQEESLKAAVLINLANAMIGASFCGFMINIIDLSPNYTSILMGVSNGTSQMMGFLAPLFAQAVIKNEEDPNDWKYMFFTTAGFLIITGIVFIIFGSGELQPWDSYDEEEDNEENPSPDTVMITQLFYNVEQIY